MPNNLMTHLEAESKIKSTPLQYASPDFYRVGQTGILALGLQDAPELILYDVANHGSEQAKALFAQALKCGYIEETIEEGSLRVYHVLDIEESGAPYYFKSHIAMQVAYPELYWEYFGGEHVWTASHPKMQALVELCVSCLVNRLHPSDYNGFHEIHNEDDEKKKPGRPPRDPSLPATTPVKGSVSYRLWIKACQKYKSEVTQAWEHYMALCEEKRNQERAGKAWLNAELDRLRAEMSEVSARYTEEMENFKQIVERARCAHAELKARGKPSKDDFE